jgi:hypothetical protein
MKSQRAIHLLTASLSSDPLLSMIAIGVRKDARCKQRVMATACGGPKGRH